MVLVGNQSGIGLYDYIQLMNLSSGGPIFGPWAGTVVTAVPSSTLVSLDRTWERIGNTNIGIDFGLLNSRLTGSFDYYWKSNNNMLLAQTYSSVLGQMLLPLIPEN